MNRLSEIKPTEVSLVKKPAIGRVFLITKSAEADESEDKMSDSNNPAAVPLSLVFKEDGTPDFDQLPPEARRVVEAAFNVGAAGAKQAIEKAETLEKQAADLAKSLAEEKDERLKRDFIEKAAREFDALPLAAAELGPVVKEIAEKAPEAWAKLEPVLKGASELIRAGNLLKETGAAGIGGGHAGDAWAKIEAMAAERIKKSGQPISKAAAISEILEENPELYAQYEREREGLK
jgi:hypothetical protein